MLVQLFLINVIVTCATLLDSSFTKIVTSPSVLGDTVIVLLEPLTSTIELLFEYQLYLPSPPFAVSVRVVSNGIYF